MRRKDGFEYMDLIVTLIITAILGGAGYAIHRSKKAGKKCIGCPDSGSCSGTCSGCCGCRK